MHTAQAGDNSFITCSGKQDRAGAQALSILSTMLFAERVGLQYVHTPFQFIAQSPEPSSQEPVSGGPELAESWEKFFNLGEGELLASQVAPHLERRRLLSLTELPFGRPNMLYAVRSAHEYANAFPDQYLRLVDRFSLKYYSSGKDSLTEYYDPSRLNVAVHVRRGDVRADNKHVNRYTPNAHVASVVEEARSAARSLGLTPSVHLYSEGDETEFGELRDMDITFHLGESPFLTFHNMVRADVLLMSKSTFSYVAALLSRGVVVYESFQGVPTNHKPLRTWLRADNHGRLDQKRLSTALSQRP